MSDFCKHCQSQIPLWDELEQRELEVLQRHIGECEKCQSLWEAYKADRQRLATLRSLSLDRTFWESFQKELQERKKIQQLYYWRQRLFWISSAGALAASLLLVVSLGVSSSLWNWSPGTESKVSLPHQNFSNQTSRLNEMVRFSVSLEEVKHHQPVFVPGRTPAQKVAPPPEARVVLPTTWMSAKNDDTVEMDF